MKRRSVSTSSTPSHVGSPHSRRGPLPEPPRPERRQRCRWIVDRRQPVSCRHGGQLPGGV